MLDYIVRRTLLLVPTLFGIMAINFAIVQFAPGGPVEQAVFKLSGIGSSAGEHSGSPSLGGQTERRYGITEETLEKIKEQYGFDKPPLQRFFLMVGNYLRFDFGESYFRNVSVVDLIKEKLPVSISLGLWSTLLIYFISIPLGIRKALKHNSSFDTWTSTVVILGYAIPGFMLGVLLIVLFAGGSFLDIFPLRGLTSVGWDEMSPFEKVKDYLWHMVLPLLAYTASGFATLTMLTKNSFLDEVHKQYVTTARAKGLTENRVLYGHVFRNAMLIVIAGFPATLVSIFFTGSILVEVVFSLDGIGLLSFQSIVKHDYPVVFSTLYVLTLIGLVLKIVSDLMYHWVDPRINFNTQG